MFKKNRELIRNINLILQMITELYEQMKLNNIFSHVSLYEQKQYREAYEYMYSSENYKTKRIAIFDSDKNIINIGVNIGYGIILNKGIFDNFTSTKKYVVLESDKNGEKEKMVVLEPGYTIQIL